LITWHARGLDVRSRNVQQEIRSGLTSGFHVKELIVDEFNRREDLRVSPIHEVFEFFKQEEVQNRLRSKLTKSYSDTRKSTLTHRWDAVDSSLTVRDTRGAEADHYGLLARMGQNTSSFRVVEPTTELIAVISSLTCKEPGAECRVGDIRRELRKLGLRPSVLELVANIESAGLCHAVADADDSLVVRSAFSLGGN
jgi:plasmid maintenance system killer protein